MSREIDAKVAECLGWRDTGLYWYDPQERYHYDKELFSFDSTGEGMLLLIEEAKKDGIRFEITTHDKLNLVLCGVDLGKHNSFTHVASHIHLPTAVTLTYLKAKGVDIKPYL
ncbi:hypothetical protein C0R09_18415 [Brevibacillus laterosporus]|uniref:hypothetical protein n=1 Tax=Brevibacillus laterosporus TaxID=1465 RepID=UPI000C781A70|nr:hypothetical protein [Brevibacillus laterosporus]AUM66332.1 hypothetical protein C0R09_18415 [Brevibacillus laterosporus]